MATLYQDDQGNWFGRIRLDWDANTELDLAGYQVECRKSDETRWRTQKVTESEAVFEGLAVGGSYYCRVKAVDKAGNESDYANFNSGSAISIPADTIAPATPANLTVTAGKKSIKIQVDKNTEGDWAGNEIHVSTENDFTPSAGTLVHSGKTTSFVYHTTSYVTHYVKVRSYDNASTPNYSAYTAQGSATPEKVEGSGGGGGGDIGPGTIGSVDIANASISSAKIQNLAVQNAHIESLSAAKISAGTLDVTVLLEAASIKAGTITGVSIVSTATIGFSDGPTISGSGGYFTVSGGINAGNYGMLIGYISTQGPANYIDTGKVKTGTITRIDGSTLKNVTVDASTVGVSGTWNIDQSLRTRSITPAISETYNLGTIAAKWDNVVCKTLIEGDHVFAKEDTCPICGKPFEIGQPLVYGVVATGEEGTRAVPMHLRCVMPVCD